VPSTCRILRTSRRTCYQTAQPLTIPPRRACSPPTALTILLFLFFAARAQKKTAYAFTQADRAVFTLSRREPPTSPSRHARRSPDDVAAFRRRSACCLFAIYRREDDAPPYARPAARPRHSLSAAPLAPPLFSADIALPHAALTFRASTSAAEMRRRDRRAADAFATLKTTRDVTPLYRRVDTIAARQAGRLHRVD